MVSLSKPRRFKSNRRAPPDIVITSLMHPDGQLPGREPPQAAWETDIGLGDLIRAMTVDRRHQPFVRKVLVGLTTDSAVIAWRQAVFADFHRNPDLAERIEALLPR